MVAILYPRRLRNQLDVTQPGGVGIPDGGVPVLYSSNSSFVIETHGGGGAFSLGASNLGNTLGQTGVTGSRIVLAGIGNLTLSQLTDANGGTISISGGTVAAGAFSAGVSGGNTAGDTGITGTRLVFAGGQSVTLSQATDANGGTITISGASTSQSVQTQNRFNLTLDGNTAGALAQISSGTMTLAGGNGITLSQAGNAVTISGNTFSQSVQPETQTFIGGVSASNTLYTSGTVRLTGAGNITVASSTGQLVVISGSQSVQPETQTFLGGLVASNTTFTSGTVSISGFGDITVNTAANLIRISGSQSLQTSNVHNVTLSGNTAGAMAQVSSGTMTLAGGNNITLSQAGNAITISGANVGGAQTGISGIIGSDATYTSGTVQFTGSGIVTVRSSANQRVVIDASQSVQPVMNLVVSNTTFSSGTVSISGFGDVTVNTAANIIRISAPTQTAQTGISGIANSQTTYTSGTVSLSELGAITIRSTTGNQYQFSVNSQTEQSQSRFNLTISGNTAGAGALISSGVMTLAGGNNVTLSQAGNAITISGGAAGGFSAGVSTGGATAGDTGVTGTRLVFVGTNNITLSQATAAAGGTVTISGPTTVAQTNQSGGVYAVGNTYSSSSGTYDARTLSLRGDGIISIAATNSGWRISASQSVQPETQTFVGGLAASNTTYTSGTITITGVGGGVTVSSNTGQRIDISVAAPVAQTNQSGGVYAVGNTYSSSSGTYDGRTMSLRGDGIISIAATNSGFRISASQSVQPETQTFLGGVSLSGNTAGVMALISSGTMNLAGGNNITLSQNGQSVTISGGAGGGFSAGLSTGGNTQGDTGVTGTRLVLVGTNNITLSQATDANGGTISISGQSPAGGAFSGGASNLGNTAGATGITGTQLVLVGSGAISLSQTTGANGGSLSILGPATSSLVGASGISISTNGSTISIMQTAGSAFLTSLAPYDEAAMVTGQQGQGSLHLAPVRVPEGVQMDRVALGIQNSNATNSSNSFSISQWFGLYTKTGSTMSLFGSTSISTNFTGSGTVGSYSLYAGPGWLTIPWTTTIPEGDYYAGIIHRTTTGGGAGHSLSQLLQSKFTNSAWSGIIGAATVTSAQRLLGQGHYSATTSAFPASIHFSQILGTGSIVLRSPIFMLRSGTV